MPTGILPEVEVFLGEVPRAEYATPGSAEFARTVLPFVGRANTVLLSNHGTLSWAASLERAFWQTEVLDSYCHILILGRQIGDVERIPERQVAELLELKEKFGAGVDARADRWGETVRKLGIRPATGRLRRRASSRGRRTYS